MGSRNNSCDRLSVGAGCAKIKPKNGSFIALTGAARLNDEYTGEYTRTITTVHASCH